MKKIINNKTILMTWSLLMTCASIVLILYTFDLKQQHRDYIQKGKLVMSNCIEKSKVANALSGNCAKAYNLTAKCMTNLYQCDMEEEKQKLRILNEEKIELEKVMDRLSEKSTELLNQN